MTRQFFRQRWCTATAAILALFLSFPSAATEQQVSAADLRPGDMLIYRHALAPGTGDPDDFNLGDCSTQRLLSDQGRTQAHAMGEQLAQSGVRVSAVWSSQWCRTVETAELAFPQLQVDERVEFNSFFRQPQLREERTAAARAALLGWDGDGVLVVITHQVNITALADVWPASGEGVLLRKTDDGQLLVIGRLPPPNSGPEP